MGIELAESLIDFIYKSPTAFHTVIEAENILKGAGFSKVEFDKKWDLKTKGKYYVIKNDSAIVAFAIGNGEVEKGFKIIGAHTDSPSFRIKPNPDMDSMNYLKLNTEVYGGPILNTWLDRPLAVAGRVSLVSSNPFKPSKKFININKPLFIIPNLAIHMNRNVNSGVELNMQKDMLPIIGLINKELEKNNYLLNLIEKETGISKEDILDFDLFLYEYEKGKVIGANNEFISSSRLDDLSMVYAGLMALVDSEPKSGINVLACFDNEEVGSRTKQGAGSGMLKTILKRISIALKKNQEDFFVGISNSFLISADMAHAVHPNVPEKADPTNKPLINRGPVIKISANQSYTTDSESSAVYEMICKLSNIPVQKFVNRSDERGGSTIGPISSTHLDIRSLDIGNPMLAMHSIRELCGVDDQLYVQKSFEEYYKF